MPNGTEYCVFCKKVVETELVVDIDTFCSDLPVECCKVCGLPTRIQDVGTGGKEHV